MVRCRDCGLLSWMASSCRIRSCPECMHKWAVREAARARERLAVGAAFYTLPWRARHVIVSPPQGPLPGTREELAALRTSGRSTLARMGFWGGCMIFHPWRCKGNRWLEGPHFHVVGYGKIDADKRPDGWVVKTKKPRKSVTSTIFYLLTHAGISRGTHSVTWFGKWAYNSLERALSETGRTFPIRQDTEAVGRCSWCQGPLEIVPKDSIHLIGWSEVHEIGG